MCGIAGYAGTKAVLAWNAMSAMRDVLVHRGPDGCGLVGWDESANLCRYGQSMKTGLAHRRLSIIDLSEAGAQPMANENESIWITYNGEFYNFQDYRKGLEENGHVFHSDCDTETIIHLYEEYGIEQTLAKMNGMFAFALWDTQKCELIMARDRAGKKPLYYAHLSDGSLLFASEIKALLASGLIDRDDLDETALDEVWGLGYSPGERTVYRQIRKLLPAHYLVWKNGQISIKEYWDCPFGLNVFHDRPENDLADELEALLIDAIRMRLIADVPVGLFLSGGVDSSLVAALAGRVTGRRIHSYTIGFPHEGFDESTYAAAIAKKLGLENHKLEVDADVMNEAGDIARQFDEPFGDSSAIPTWIVSKLARKYVTVALTGDGGDEAFAGYDFQRQAVRIWGAGEQRRAFQRSMTKSERFWELKLRLLGFRRGYAFLERRMSLRNREQLFTASFRDKMGKRKIFDDRWKWYDRVKGTDRLSQMQYLMFKTWLPDDFLRKVDTASMAHSLECRCPLLDYRITEFASQLPFSAKISPEGRGKHLLRTVLARYVPRELFERPKQGFMVPWEHWCRGEKASGFRKQWRSSVKDPYEPNAADMLFPDDGSASNFMSWTGFSVLALMGGETDLIQR